MIPLNYHHLYYFHVIAKEGSIARACDKLYLAQPTLSTQLKQFEKAIGRLLFERDKRRLRLTEDGRLVLDYAESIFGLGQELQDALRDRPGGGQLAIQIGILNGTPRSFAQTLLEGLLDFSPNAQLEVREGEMGALLRDLREHRLDIVLTDVGVHGRDQAQLANHVIGRVPVVFAASPRLARAVGRVPRGLEGAPLILPSHPSQVHRQVLELLSEWKVKPRIFAEVQDSELARRLAAAGRGIVALNADSVGSPRGDLAVLAGSRDLGIQETVTLVTLPRKVSNPLAEHLIKNVRIRARVPAGPAGGE